jgi:glycosyltransferase involved in cell wall biosynthesis
MGVEQRMKLIYEGLGEIGDVDVYVLEQLDTAGKNSGKAAGSIRDDASKKSILFPYQLRKTQKLKTVTSRLFHEMNPEHYDIVFVHRPGTAWLAGWTDPKRTILDIDDITSRVYYERMRLGNPIFRLPRWSIYHWAKICERAQLKAFRFNLVCSDTDKAYFDNDNVAIVANAFWIGDQQRTPNYVPGRRDMLFVGSLGWPPNATGLIWFCDNVFPLIRREIPEARLVIIGRMPSKNPSVLKLRDIDGIDLVGTVDHVEPYINDTKIEICPLLSGQGTRIKILESLAHAKPVVSTSSGAHGSVLTENEGLFRCDDPAHFAKTCIRLLRDEKLRVETGTAGREYVLKNASPNVTKQQIKLLTTTILEEQGLVSEPDNSGSALPD